MRGIDRNTKDYLHLILRYLILSYLYHIANLFETTHLIPALSSGFQSNFSISLLHYVTTNSLVPRPSQLVSPRRDLADQTSRPCCLQTM